MPTRNTVADAPLDCMFLAFEGLQPRTRLWIKPLSQSLGDWLISLYDTFGQFGTVRNTSPVLGFRSLLHISPPCPGFGVGLLCSR